MSNEMYEVLRDGVPTKQLFFTTEQAREWIRKHNDDGAQYETRPFTQKPRGA